MNEQALEMTGWENKVAQLAAEMKAQEVNTGWLFNRFRSELRTYAPLLAWARAKIEASQGTKNPDRDAAWEEYSKAVLAVTKAFDLPDNDGSEWGKVSPGFPNPPHTRADRIELAEREVDRALLRYAAK